MSMVAGSIEALASAPPRKANIALVSRYSKTFTMTMSPMPRPGARS
jgi:hypothetical protein